MIFTGLMLSQKLRAVVVTLALLGCSGCSTHVSPGKVSGTYIASYPFGRARLVLHPNSTFVQTVEVSGQPPVTVRGSWSFDSTNSKIALHGLMPVVDSFGHLKENWQEVDNFDEQPVERLWFRIEIETNESYGYVKQ